MGVERAGAALIRRHSTLQIIHLLYNLISSLAFLPPPSPCRGASPTPPAPPPIKELRGTPGPPLVAWKLCFTPRGPDSACSGASGGLCLPRGGNGGAEGSPSPCPVLLQPPHSCSQAGRKSPLFLQQEAPRACSEPRADTTIPSGSPSAPSPDPGGAGTAPCLSCRSCSRAAHGAGNEGSPHPISPPDSLSAPNTAQSSPRFDISLQPLRLCSFPWQQQTHNYRYIILYKPSWLSGRGVRFTCSQPAPKASRQLPPEHTEVSQARRRCPAPGCPAAAVPPSPGSPSACPGASAEAGK